MSATAVRERPILFSAPMVRALLDGRKTQTRRLVRPGSTVRWASPEPDGKQWALSSPYGSPGDRLWVRETWQWDPAGTLADCYAADGCRCGFAHLWRSPLFMPRARSRIDLDVVSVRVERLQEISEEDAKAEGVDQEGYETGRLDANGSPDERGSYRLGFLQLWDSLNRERAPWASNPWVWVIEFRRTKP